MTTLGIIQARMGSTRLPGKVLRKLAGRTVLDRVVRAARNSGVLDDLVVATTTDPIDDAVEAECAAIGVACYRGPVDDVLTRFLGVLERHESDTIMRFTADCPLLDSRLVAMAWQVFTAAGVDYLTSVARVDSPFLTAFEVLDVFPLDEKTLRRVVLERGLGPLEIKTRGLDVRPEALRARLRPHRPIRRWRSLFWSL